MACLLAVMILTTVIIKGIFCWMHCYKPSPWEKPAFSLKKKREKDPQSGNNVIHMEIPMEDMERTSTPVPSDEKLKPRPDYHSDV